MKNCRATGFWCVRWLMVVLSGVLCLLFTVSCGDDDDSDSDSETEDAGEFIAALGDFTDFEGSFEPIDYTIGGFHQFLSSAHMADMDSYSRISWINSVGAGASGETYPVGTIVIKETMTWDNGAKKYADEGGLLGMVKRGGTFNADHHNWEWFVLKPDLSEIAARGGNDVMDGACNSCHANATGTAGKDYVFSHPGEFNADAEDFADYSTWTLIGENTGQDPVLGSAHSPDSLRKTYRHPILGKPDSEFGGYPIGTMIVKEIIVDDAITEIDAMVKRGGDFNPDHAGWEWFVIDAETGAIANRGADLMGGVCNSCHTQALKAEHGQDYVFKHDDDPFNK